MKRAAIVAVVLMCATARAQTIQVDKNNRTIAVTAQDKATAPADLAAVTVGFQAFAPDAATAYAKGSQLSNGIVSALKKAGVPDAAIESQQQTLHRTTFPFDDKSTLEERAQKVFTLTQSWTVHTAAADAAGVLHAAIEAGANESGNIGWDLKDRNGLQAKAAAKALQRAHEVAQQMAAGLGVQLGPLIYASNQAPMPPVPMFRAESRAFLGSPAAAVAPLALRPQQVEENATVYAVFAIE